MVHHMRHQLTALWCTLAGRVQKLVMDAEVLRSEAGLET
jgi:hypothetical protein